jgi:hypothetical protein
MQIEFQPHKIKAAKAYLQNLYGEEKSIEKKVKKKKKVSFFRRLFGAIFRRE